MINKLNWDSEFFGYEIGQIEINSNEILNLEQLVKEAANYKLVYLISDQEIKTALNNMTLVDIKIRLSKDVVEKMHLDCDQIIEYDGSNSDDLKQLSLQSGGYSRFKNDANFTTNEFEKLYYTWLKESIKKTIADNVVVWKEYQEYKGFITLKCKEAFAEIGLIAVDEKSRGKGIGLNLLTFINNLVSTKRINKIMVATQLKNQPAMELYKKAGYKIDSKKYIYHIWN